MSEQERAWGSREPSSREGAGPGGGPRTRCARRHPDGPHHRVSVCPPGGAAPPGGVDRVLHEHVAQQAVRDHGACPPCVGEERTSCALPTIGIAPAQRNAQQGRHTDCRG